MGKLYANERQNVNFKVYREGNGVNSWVIWFNSWLLSVFSRIYNIVIDSLHIVPNWNFELSWYEISFEC